MTIADPLLWHASGTAARDRPRLAKVRTVTQRELRIVVMHGQ
jgi:hypothetical protein